MHIDRKNLPLADDVTIESIALPTTGFTGADLANLVNEAALLAGRKGHSKVAREDFDAAILRATAGIEKKRSLVKGLEKSVIAKHEVHHFSHIGGGVYFWVRWVMLSSVQPSPVCFRALPKSRNSASSPALAAFWGETSHQASHAYLSTLISRFTYIPPGTDDRILMFDSDIRAQLAILLGGRAAEMLTCDDISTGASDDIKKATTTAYQSISEYGLSKTVGPVSVQALLQGGSQDALFPRDNSKMTELVEEEVKILIDAALTVAQDVIHQNRNIHEGLSIALEKEERLEGEDLQNWLSHIVIPTSLRQFVLDGTPPGHPSIDEDEATIVSTDIVDTPSAEEDPAQG